MPDNVQGNLTPRLTLWEKVNVSEIFNQLERAVEAIHHQITLAEVSAAADVASCNQTYAINQH
jgi:hypothetical protein